MNDIGITWTSDQKQLIADMQKRQLMQDAEIARLTKLAGAGKTAGTALTGAYRDAGREIDRLGKLADSGFKKSVSAMDAHAARMKEIRVLYRMGRIDVEQFNKAAQASLKQKLTDSGVKARLNEQKRAAAELAALQAKQLADEKAAAVKSLAEQRDAVKSFALQKAQALHDAEMKARADAKASLEEQKAAAKSFQLQKLTALEEEKQKNKAAAEQVRKGLLSERQIANATFRERMRHLQDLQRAGELTSQQYQAGAKQAHDAWKKVAGIDMSKMWSGVPSQLTGILSTTAAIAAAMKLARQEFDNMRSRQKEALDIQNPYADEFRTARANLEEQTPEKFEWLDKEVKKTALEIGMSPVETMRRVGAVLGAKGGGSDADAISAVKEAAILSGNKPELLESTASAIAQTKTFQPKMSDRELAGRFTIARRVTPTIDQGFFDNVAPQLGLGTNGDSFGDSSALWGYYANALQDKEGNISTNQMIHMQKLMTETMSDVKGTTADKLKAFHSDKFASRRQDVLGKFFEKEGLDGGQIAEVMDAKDKVPGYAKGFMPSVKLLRGDKDALEQFERLQKANLVTPKEAEDVVNTLKRHVESNPRLRKEEAGRRAGAATDNIRLDDPEANVSAIRDNVNKAMKATGQWEMTTWAADTEVSLGSQMPWGKGEAEAQVDRLRDTIEANRRAAETNRSYAKHAKDPRHRKAFEEQEARYEGQNEKLLPVLKNIEKLLTDQANAPVNVNAPAVNVNVNMPGAGEKPPQPAAAGLGGGRL